MSLIVRIFVYGLSTVILVILGNRLLFSTNYPKNERCERNSDNDRSTIKYVSKVIGATTALELEPDYEFLNTTTYKDMEKFVRARHNTKQLIRDFDKNGYVIFKPEFKDEIFDAATKFTHSIYTDCYTIGGSSYNKTCRLFDRFLDQKSVRNVALNYHILAILAILHKHNPYPFQTLTYPLTSLARTHSDYIHFGAYPLPLMAAAWIAFEDIHPDAGPVFYHKSSHKLPFYNMQDFGLHPRQDDIYNYPKYQDIMEESLRQFGQKEDLIIPKGHCLLWSANLAHGGAPAINKKLLRLSQVTHYFFHGSVYNWAPVGSNIHEDKIWYYDKDLIARQWDTSVKLRERRAIEKVSTKGCDAYTKDTPHIPSPCDMQTRPPLVLSKLLPYKLKNFKHPYIRGLVY